MNYDPQLILVGAVAVVGVLHTMVPDHWVPITLIARQRGWSKRDVVSASMKAGTGHVFSTLLIAMVVWLAGVAVAKRFGHFVDLASSTALIIFGAWIAISAWRELRKSGGHGHSHEFPHLHDHHPAPQDSIHGPELQRIDTGHSVLELSIFEAGVPPCFRLTGANADEVKVETKREDGERQIFLFSNRGAYLESTSEIPEPHQFYVNLILGHGNHAHSYATQFTEHSHSHHEAGHDHELEIAEDSLYLPSRGGAAVLTKHVHSHRHGKGSAHIHWHDHTLENLHNDTSKSDIEPPLHEHSHKTNFRTALILILGSSPMVEGIPAFFAAGKYGAGLILLMSAVFAISTIATYVLLCVYSTQGLQRVKLGVFERYGEVFSGAFISLVGLVFWLWPVL